MNLSRCFWFIDEAACMCVSTCKKKTRRFPAKEGELGIDRSHLSHVVEIPMSDRLLLGHLPDLVEHRM